MSPPSIADTPSARLLRLVTARRVAFLLSLLLLAAAALFVRFNLKGRFAGLFLLEGKGRYVYEIKDDLYLGDGRYLIAGVDFGPLRRAVYRKVNPRRLETSLELDWDEAEGEGTVVSHFPGGRKLVTAFSRFLDDDEDETKGLFVGGGSPGSVDEDNVLRLSETGMAWWNGRRWLHLWCSVNEAIGLSKDPKKLSYPAHWRFLGSRVIQDGPRRVVLRSEHVTTIDGVPIHIERYAYFHAGETFFRLGIKIRNDGSRPVSVYYLYGDEPWVGTYGSSAGNVGWTSTGLVRHAASIDPVSHRYAGMYDCGNRLIEPVGNATFAANFIEWLGPNRPSLVYFSNDDVYDPADEANRVPLAGNTRFIGLQFEPPDLRPGEETAIFLAIGMASVDPRSGLPVKPDVPLYAPLD
jgi:hypothetical protein